MYPSSILGDLEGTRVVSADSEVSCTCVWGQAGSTTLRYRRAISTEMDQRRMGLHAVVDLTLHSEVQEEELGFPCDAFSYVPRVV